MNPDQTLRSHARIAAAVVFVVAVWACVGSFGMVTANVPEGSGEWWVIVCAAAIVFPLATAGLTALAYRDFGRRGA